MVVGNVVSPSALNNGEGKQQGAQKISWDIVCVYALMSMPDLQKHVSVSNRVRSELGQTGKRPGVTR